MLPIDMISQYFYPVDLSYLYQKKKCSARAEHFD